MVIANFEAETCYYGIMFDGLKSGNIYLSSLKFTDLPKPLIVNKVLKTVTLLNHSEYLYQKVELDAIDELQEIELEEKLRHPLYVEFCSKEKIPFRIAYEHEDFFIVSRNIEEIKLKK